MRKILAALAVLLAPVPFLVPAPVTADESSADDAALAFIFGNHIDTHLQTRLVRGAVLKGSLYIIFTGEIDPASGLPIARHPRGAMHNEECGFDIDCVVGWKVRGRPGVAKFVSHSGVNGHDHPVWLVNRVDIPQPGAFSHFHWIGADSSDQRALMGDVPAVCDVDMAGELEGRVIAGEIEVDDEVGDDEIEFAADIHVGDGAEDSYCPGWFLQLRAVETFAFRHRGEVVAVRPGIDIATHLNLLTNYAIVPTITPTRMAH